MEHARVNGGGHQVVGGGDGVDVAGEMEIEFFHRDDLAVAAAGRAALDAEGGALAGWRMQVNTFLPRCAPRAWLRPTVVVVLPSPSGVGVMAVTTMYLPLGAPFNRSRTYRWTFALYLPYSSSSSGKIPASAAILSMGSGFAAWAISRSLGTGVLKVR